MLFIPWPRVAPAATEAAAFKLGLVAQARAVVVVAVEAVERTAKARARAEKVATVFAESS
jgi:hypothetical protein